MRRGSAALKTLKNGRGTADGGQWARAHGHVPVAQAFRPEDCSGRGMIAVAAKNLTSQSDSELGSGVPTTAAVVAVIWAPGSPNGAAI